MLSIDERKMVIRWHSERKTQQEIAKLLKCSQAAISKFLKKYGQSGSFADLPRSGRPTKLTPTVLEKLKKKITKFIKDTNAEFCSVSTKQVGRLIKKEIGETYSLRHVERIMHRLGFSLITPRPQHIRHDQTKVDAFRDEFKKNSSRFMWIMS